MTPMNKVHLTQGAGTVVADTGLACQRPRLIPWHTNSSTERFSNNLLMFKPGCSHFRVLSDLSRRVHPEQLVCSVLGVGSCAKIVLAQASPDPFNGVSEHKYMQRSGNLSGSSAQRQRQRSCALGLLQ